MSKILSKEYILFLVIIGINSIILAIVAQAIYPLYLSFQNPLVFDLLEWEFKFPFYSYYIVNFLCLFLIYFLGKSMLEGKRGLIPALIFSLSPWIAYLTVAKSFYIFLLLFILLIIVGMVILSKNSLLGTIFFISGILLSVYSSIFLLIIAPFFIVGIKIFRLFNLNQLNKILILILILAVPLFIFIARNTTGIKNILDNNIQIYSDIGLKNSINTFQGESRKKGYSKYSKISENKYVYFFKFTLHKLFKNITPSTFFTPEQRLLNFSFTPPFFVGFLIPFLYGFYLVIKDTNYRKAFILSLLLIIPSFLSRDLVNLNYLSLFFPSVLFIISLGLIQMFLKKNNFFKGMIYLVLFLIIAQLLITISDMRLREYARHDKRLNISIELTNQ